MFSLAAAAKAGAVRGLVGIRAMTQVRWATTAIGTEPGGTLA